MKVIVFYDYLNPIGGIETVVYNWCYHMKDIYDITVLCDGDSQQLSRLADLVTVESYSPDGDYLCDTLINHKAWKELPKNIHYKRLISMIHADYTYASQHFDVHYVDNGGELVAISQVASKAFDKLYHVKSQVLEGLLSPEITTHRILHLVSATRLTKEKGLKRMIQLAQAFNDHHIRFDWKVFTTGDVPDMEGFIKMSPALDIYDYLADADYTVQLSDTEALCCVVRESLLCKTPVIVTDIPAFHDLIINGKNGYLLPLDMSDIDVDEIYNHIPTDVQYDDHVDDLKKAWIDIVGKPNSKQKSKPSARTTKELVVIKSYYDKDLQINCKVGDILTVPFKRALLLTRRVGDRPAVCKERK